MYARRTWKKRTSGREVQKNAMSDILSRTTNNLCIERAPQVLLQDYVAPSINNSVGEP